MPLVQISGIEGYLTLEQKQDLIRKVTDAVVAVEGEGMPKSFGPKSPTSDGSRSCSMSFTRARARETRVPAVLPTEDSYPRRSLVSTKSSAAWRIPSPTRLYGGVCAYDGTRQLCPTDTVV